MTYVLWGRDIGIITLGRKALKACPKADLTFCIQSKVPAAYACGEPDLWTPALEQVMQSLTRFGRVGIVVDRRNQAALSWSENLAEKTWEYTPSDRRAEKTPRITILETQLLHHMALEGMADTVEFRRLARKYLRDLKNSHVDTVFFPEGIFGEAKTQNILQHLAGTQMRVVTLVDTWEVPDLSPGKKRVLDFEVTGEENDFVRARAQQILQTKLS